MTALLPSEIPMNRLTISGLFAPTAAATVFSNFFLHSVYRREGSIANTHAHAEWVIMVWRKAAVSARKAEDHAERRRPVNQPRGLNRRESAPFDSARRWGLLLPKSYPLARKAVAENGKGGSARYSADPASPHQFAAGNRALDANRDRASARCRDLQCPGRRSLCRRAKQAGLSTDHGRPSARAPSPSTNQAECPLIPLYKGITGPPQQTEECCPRLPCVRGAGRRGGLRGCLPFLLLSPKTQRKACRFTRQAFHGIRR